MTEIQRQLFGLQDKKYRDFMIMQVPCAWYFATALATNYEEVIPYIEERKLKSTVHKMTVRKACESFRISEEKKAYIKKFK